MSAYSEQTTEFKDAGLLCAALREHFSDVQLHDTAQQLEGYHGDKRAETAEIIVPRRVVGCASNDIGFKRQADGSYAAIVSEFDQHSYNATFFTKLRVSYSEKFTIQRAAKHGLRYIGKKTVNRKVQLQFLKA